MKKLLETNENCIDLPINKSKKQNNNNNCAKKTFNLLEQQPNMAQLMAQSMAQLFQTDNENNSVDMASIIEAIGSFCKFKIYILSRKKTEYLLKHFFKFNQNFFFNSNWLYKAINNLKIISKDC